MRSLLVLVGLRSDDQASLHILPEGNYSLFHAQCTCSIAHGLGTRAGGSGAMEPDLICRVSGASGTLRGDEMDSAAERKCGNVKSGEPDIYSFRRVLITSRYLKKACYTPLCPVYMSPNNAMDVFRLM